MSKPTVKENELPITCMCTRCKYLRASQQLKEELRKDTILAIEEPTDYGYAYFGLNLMQGVHQLMGEVETLRCDIKNPLPSPDDDEIPF